MDRAAFGKYHVLARLGAGGMGHVHLAVNVGPGGVQKLVVIKQLREDLAASISARSMFLDEARIATRLHHPHVVQTHEVVDEGEDLYLVMEFLDGQPLARILDAKHATRFSLPVRLRIIADALFGLHYAHELSDFDGTPLNVVHRDVSPHNIVVTYDGHVKIVDFGVAKAADTTTVTASGVFKGKVRYSSPEQAMCTNVDRRADVFAMGTILFETIAGRRMWQEEPDASVLIALASGKIPALRAARPDVPEALEAICARALAVDPSARFQSANEFRLALLEYMRATTDDGSTELGAAVATAFARERSEMRALIDTQMRHVRETTSTGAMTVRRIPIFTAETGSTEGARGGIAMEPAPPSQASGGPRSPSRGPWVVAGGALVVAILGIAAVAARHSSAPVAVAEAAPPKPEARVHVRLHASPPTARLVLDGNVLVSSSFEADLPRDLSRHSLTVSADGYDPRDLAPSFARDVDIDVSLSPATPSSPAISVTSLPLVTPEVATPTTAPAPRAPTALGATKPVRPLRTIDEEDPYKK